MMKMMTLLSDLPSKVHSTRQMNREKSPAQIRQSLLFRLLGSLSRDRTNLQNLARPTNFSPELRAIAITPVEQKSIDEAVYVLGNIIARAKLEMASIKSITPIKKVTK